MAIMTKYFNSDSDHQYLVKEDNLMSINIFIDETIVRQMMFELLNYHNNSNCLLMDEDSLKKYKFPVTMYCIGNFRHPYQNKHTLNYLVPNNKLLFLLNHIYQKINIGKSLTNNDLKKIYDLKCETLLKNKASELRVINNLIQNIIIDVKNIYDYKNIEKISFGSVEMLMQEKLNISVLNISGILENALNNSELFNKLNINQGYQKSKA